MRQTLLLLENCIDTIGDLIIFKKAQEQKLTSFQKERAKLYKVVAKSSDAEKAVEAKERLKGIKSELKTIRSSIRNCESIEGREPNLDMRIKEIKTKISEEHTR